MEGDAGMSAGILMRSGSIEIKGDAGRNAGVLMKGGRIVIAGKADDFTAAEMRGGEIFVAGDAGGFIWRQDDRGRRLRPKGKADPPRPGPAGEGGGGRPGLEGAGRQLLFSDDLPAVRGLIFDDIPAGTLRAREELF